MNEIQPIECYLRAPRAVVEASFSVIAGPYTTYFGLHAVDVAPLAFGKVVYGGVCAHSAIHTALILMDRFGSRPLGLLELTTLYPRIQCELRRQHDSPDPERSTAIGPDMQPGDYIFTIDGLNHMETQSMFRAEESGLWSVSLALDEHEVVDDHGTTVDLSDSANAILCACIRSGICPVVFIDFPTYRSLVRFESAEAEEPAGAVAKKREGHAVVLVGFRTVSGPVPSIEYLVHDSYLGPWRRILDRDLWTAMTEFVDPKEAHRPKVCVVPLPIEVKMTPTLAMWRAADFIARLLDEDKNPPPERTRHIWKTMKLRLVARAEAFSLCRSSRFGDKHQQDAQAYLSAWWAKADYLWRATYQEEKSSVIVYVAPPGSYSAVNREDGVRHEILAYAKTDLGDDGLWKGTLFLHYPSYVPKAAAADPESGVIMEFKPWPV